MFYVVGSILGVLLVVFFVCEMLLFVLYCISVVC